MLHDIFPGLELYYTDPAQPLKTTGEELDDLDHDPVSYTHLTLPTIYSV